MVDNLKLGFSISVGRVGIGDRENVYVFVSGR